MNMLGVIKTESATVPIYLKQGIQIKEPVDKLVKEVSEVVKTGDNSNVVVLLVIFIAAVVVAAILISRKRRKSS